MDRHQIFRNPEAPWFELRVSSDSSDCYRRHSHAQYSVGIVDEGEASFQHARGVDWIRKGTVVLIEPEVLHACNPVRGQRWSYRMAYLDAGWFEAAVQPLLDLKNEAPRLVFTASTMVDSHLAAAVDGLFRLPLGSAEMQQLGAQLPQLLAPFVHGARPLPQGNKASIFGEIVQRIASDPAANFQIMDLAKSCGMSASLFVRQFKGEFGMPPGRYIQNARLNAVRRLISQGMPLVDAAQCMGFSDQSHLQRAFKAHHAMTPGRYARSAQPQ